MNDRHITATIIYTYTHNKQIEVALTHSLEMPFLLVEYG